jgi:hypothetical protein
VSGTDAHRHTQCHQARAAGDESGLARPGLLNPLPHCPWLVRRSTNKYQIGIHDQTKDGDKRPLLVMKASSLDIQGFPVDFLCHPPQSCCILAAYCLCATRCGVRSRVGDGLPLQRVSATARPVAVSVSQGAPERVWTAANRILVNGQELPKTAEWEQKFNTVSERREC